MFIQTKTVKERFEEKYIPEPNSGCWLWTAATNLQGYGRVRIGQTHRYAHRVSWGLYVGNIPSGLSICHRCDTPACVNPEHLFLGTHSDNAVDSVNKSRHRNSRKTHCKNGHMYDVLMGKHRRCRVCFNKTHLEWWYKNSGRTK